MLVFDTNVLVHAANQDSALHLACRQRLEQARRDPSPAFCCRSTTWESERAAEDARNVATLGITSTTGCMANCATERRERGSP